MLHKTHAIGLSLLVPLVCAVPESALAQPCLQWIRRNVAPNPDATTRIAFDQSRGELIAVSGVNEYSPTCWTWRWNGTAWDVLSTDGPPSRSYFEIAYDSNRGVIVMFGGLSPTSTPLSDTWEWDGLAWSQKLVSGPSARYRSAMCFDSAQGMTILLGGSGLSDTWTWDGIAWTQRQASIAKFNQFYPPALAFDSLRNVSVLVALHIYGELTTWEWSGTNWAQRAYGGLPWRTGFGLAYDSDRARTVLFGGSAGGIVYYGDSWEWNGFTWTLRHSNGPTRTDTSMAYDSANKNLFVLGGTIKLATSTSTRSDLWSFDGADWNRLNDGRPCTRDFHAMAYDSTRRRTVLFGGSRDPFGAFLLGDTWEWDGARWSLVSTTGPSARFLMPMAFDEHRSACVIYGGTDGLSSVPDTEQETWEWNGEEWSRRAEVGPGNRFNTALVYDNAETKCVLYGGYDSSGILTDTWKWDGLRWMLASASGGPSVLWNRAIAFDSRRDVIVGFGGTDFSVYPSETWEWDNSAWTQKRTAFGPTGRYRHASAFDSRRGVHLLLGGGQAYTYNNELWQWDGAEWIQLLPAEDIPARGAHSMVFDSHRNQLVVFGGIANSPPYGAPLGDLWELDLTATPTAVTHPSSPSICAGGSVTLKSSFDGPGPFTYRWRKDGQWLSDDGHRFGADTNTLVLINAQATDAGIYECRAVNVCAQALCKPATLTVFPTNTADGNLDGLVDARDIAVLVDALTNFAPVSQQLCAHDLTDEGIVNTDDIPPFVTRLLAE